MIPLPPLKELPQEDTVYGAHAVSELFSSPVGTDGRLEFYFLAVIPQLGDRLWPVVVASGNDVPLSKISDYYEVRFVRAAYFRHADPPPAGQLYHDARFYVAPSEIEMR